MSDIVEIMRARKEPTIEVDMHYPQIVDSDTPDAECLEAADEIEWLRATLREIVLITDRKHDAWDRAKLLLGGQL